jgi:hypothetical protein
MTVQPNISAGRSRWLLILIIISLIVLVATAWNAYQKLGMLVEPANQPGALRVHEIPLDGPVSQAAAEISGMAWYGDWLILLPQYPSRFDDQLFALSRREITAFLDGESSNKLTPRSIQLESSGIEARIPGFEGFEAIGFDGIHVFVTIEANENGEMVGYIVRGEAQPGEPPVSFVLDGASIQKIEPQANLSNYADESLLIFQGTVYTIYEANGANINPNPQAHSLTKT